MVLSKKYQCRKECAQDLGENVIWHLFPWKALPYRKANGDGGIEMSSRCARAANDSERNTKAICQSYGKDGSIRRTLLLKYESCCCCYSRVYWLW